MSRGETYYKDGAIIVRGPRVTNTSDLADLKLGPDEAAVIITPDILRLAMANLNKMERTGKAPDPNRTEV